MASAHPRPPIYHAGKYTYRIDSCRPQLAAVAAGKIKFHALTHGHYPGRKLPARLLPGITSLGHWDAWGQQDWGLEDHRNEGIEIVWLETGGMPFVVDEKKFALQAGDLAITRPWQLHRLGDPHLGPGRLHWLILDVGVRRPNQSWRWPKWVQLDPADLKELTDKLRLNEHPVWHGTAELAHNFSELARCVERYDSERVNSCLLIHLNHLLWSLLEALRAQSRRADHELISRRRTVDLFLKDLAANPASLAEQWSLSALATHCGIGLTQFVEHCRSLTNLSPVQYLIRCRLEHAARRLRAEPDATVTHLALDCGFASSQYFATVFRRRFGWR
ncbi:MAG: AraC family transcriptional regulator [Kiritimatiellaeota bacterium]|nr:AraC family transcriptional regulator [Kiritimatiellota bacterium]